MALLNTVKMLVGEDLGSSQDKKKVFQRVVGVSRNFNPHSLAGNKKAKKYCKIHS